MIPPYPLHWPDALPRSTSRVKSAFRTTLGKAIENVQTSLRLFGSESGKPAANVVCSSNVGGLLSTKAPDDPGVAVWFDWDGEQRCIAVDRYGKVEENLQAIHHVLEARRTEMRHAGIVMVRAAFKGFTAALPAPDRRPWWDVLSLPRDSDEDAVKAAWRALAREFATRSDVLRELNVARDAALLEILKR